jgi:hypothetical protein
MINDCFKIGAFVEHIGEQPHLECGSGQLPIEAHGSDAGLTIGKRNHFGALGLELTGHPSQHRGPTGTPESLQTRRGTSSGVACQVDIARRRAIAEGSDHRASPRIDALNHGHCCSYQAPTAGTWRSALCFDGGQYVVNRPLTANGT